MEAKAVTPTLAWPWAFSLVGFLHRTQDVYSAEVLPRTIDALVGEKVRVDNRRFLVIYRSVVVCRRPHWCEVLQ